MYLDDFLPVYLIENSIEKFEEIHFVFMSPNLEKYVDVFYCFLEKYLAKLAGSYE